MGDGTPAPTEVARAGYAAWNTGDLERFLETVHPEVLWRTTGVFPGLRETYSGHDGVREFWAAFNEPWQTLEIDFEGLYELDPSSVIVQVVFKATGRDGIELDYRLINHLTIRDGRLWRFHGYPDWETALAELGIEDPRS